MQKENTSKLKFIYWFAYYNLDSPSVRYRGKYPLDFLKSNYGVKSYFVIPGYRPAKVLNFLRAYFSALLFRKPASLIVVQRVKSNFIYSSLLKLLIRVRKSNTVYDLDDADYLESPPETIYYFIKHCSAVQVGSNELVRKLSPFNNNIILNTSPTPDLEIMKQEKNGSFTVGWIGDFAGGHKEGMINDFFPAMKDLPFKVKLTLLGVKRKTEFNLVTDFFRPFANVELEMPQDIDWQNEKDIQHRISKFDVGIATLLNTELHRSKSAFKVKQYLNNGIPVLSSPIPENSNFVIDGKNGFLCNSPEDFRKRLIAIKEMNFPDYSKLSNAARTDSSKFNLSRYAEIILSNVE